MSASLAYELVPEGGKINLGGSLEHAIKKKVEGEKEANYNQNWLKFNIYYYNFGHIIFV